MNHDPSPADSGRAGATTVGSSRADSSPSASRTPQPRRRRRFARPAAPAILDGILAAWERFDRRRRRIRPARPGALVGVELRRHRHGPVQLADGTVVRRGDLIGEIHLDNELVRASLAHASWMRLMRQGRADLDAVARWSRSLPEGERPVAYHGATVLWPLAERAGFEIVPRRRTAYVRLDEWFLRWLLVHWSPEGRRRLEQGRSRLRSAEAWLSRRALEARLEPGTGVPGEGPWRAGGATGPPAAPQAVPSPPSTRR